MSSDSPAAPAPLAASAPSPFPKDDRSDLILRVQPDEADVFVDFYVETLHLQSQSTVFYDMLQIGSTEQGAKKDGMPIVALKDAVEDLVLLLQHIVPSRMTMDELTLDQAKRLLAISDKYDTPFPKKWSLNYLLKHAKDGSEPLLLFGLGVAYGSVELARSALAHFDGSATWCQSVCRTCNGCHRIGRPFQLQKVPEALLACFPLSSIINFLDLQDSISRSSSSSMLLTWKSQASKFTIDEQNEAAP